MNPTYGNEKACAQFTGVISDNLQGIMGYESLLFLQYLGCEDEICDLQVDSVSQKYTTCPKR